MDSTLANPQNYPVSQNEPRPPELEVWEPPFERWLRIADAALCGTTTPRKEAVSAPRF